MDAGGLLFLFLFLLAAVDAVTHLATMVVAAIAVVAATMAVDVNRLIIPNLRGGRPPLFFCAK